MNDLQDMRVTSANGIAFLSAPTINAEKFGEIPWDSLVDIHSRFEIPQMVQGVNDKQIWYLASTVVDGAVQEGWIPVRYLGIDYITTPDALHFSERGAAYL